MRYASLVLVLCLGCDDGGSGGSEPSPDAGADGEARRLADTGPAPDAATTCEATAEVCDGADNDCDGKTDEGFGLGAPCRAGMATCSVEGTIVCTPEGEAACSAVAPEPTDEACDGVDNDCDGAADEGFNFATDAQHCGGCMRPCAFDNGSAACDEGVCVLAACAEGFGDADDISANGCECAMAAPEERCDGLDTDCDGEVDEGFDLGAACTVGEGACANVGAAICAVDGSLGCDTEARAPGEESCNGFDDDCDGSIDEGFDADEDGAPFCGLDCEAPCPEGVDCERLCRAQDCDDADPARHPAARDLCGDDVDQNCDGIDASCDAPAGRITALAIADAGAPGCRDFNGDGRSDNALALAALAANAQLNDSIRIRELNLMPVAMGMTAPGTDGRFDFGMLIGIPDARDQNTYDLSDNSIDAAGDPAILLPGANVIGGEMQAGPGDFNLDLPFLQGVRINLRVRDTQLTGRMSVDGRGLSIAMGWLSGIVTDEDFRGLLALLPPEIAPFIEPLIRPDIDTDGDGEFDAYTTCLSFTVTPVTLRGFPVQR